MRDIASRPLITGLLLTLISGEPVMAQSRPTEGALEAATRGLNVGTRVRVLTGDDARSSGSFLGLDERGLRLTVADGNVSVFRTLDVVELSRQRRAWRTGLWIGAGVGALIGGVFGAGQADSGGKAGGAAYGVLAVGVPFGGAGALLGALFHEWHPIYP